MRHSPPFQLIIGAILMVLLCVLTDETSYGAGAMVLIAIAWYEHTKPRP